MDKGRDHIEGLPGADEPLSGIPGLDAPPEVAPPPKVGPAPEVAPGTTPQPQPPATTAVPQAGATASAGVPQGRTWLHLLVALGLASLMLLLLLGSILDAITPPRGKHSSRGTYTILAVVFAGLLALCIEW